MTTIKRLLLGLAIALGLGVSTTSAAEPEFRVLFLGNSPFRANGGSLAPFERFCEAANVKAKADSQEGRIDPFIRNQAGDPKIHSLIRMGRFSHVVLLTRATDFVSDADQKAAFAGFKKLHETIIRSGGRTVICMANPVRGQYASYDRIRRGHRSLQAELEQLDIDGAKHSVTLVPVGLLWIEGQARFGEKNWYSDDHHGTELAQFANGCLWYAYVTGQDPRKNTFTGGLPERASNWVKNKVWEYHEAKP